MDEMPCSLKHSELTDRIIGAFYDVYNELGHGFLESTDAEAMVRTPEAAGLQVSREVPVPVWFRRQKIGQYFADILVERVILLELKAGRILEKHTKRSCCTTCEQRKLRSGSCSASAFAPNSGVFSSTTIEKRSVANSCA